MKRKVSKKPFGHRLYYSMALTELPQNYRIEPGFGYVSLQVAGKDIEVPEHRSRKGWQFWKLPEITSIAKKRRGKAELTIGSALHDETYEFNRKDGRWRLVNQGPGFA
jgi:hypothetical protein